MFPDSFGHVGASPGPCHCDPLGVALMVSRWLPQCRHHAVTHIIQRQKEERHSARALLPLLLEEGFFFPEDPNRCPFPSYWLEPGHGLESVYLLPKI